MERIRKGDMVVVVSGSHAGTRGRVLRVLPDVSKVIVEGVNRVKKHQKPTPRGPGGIIEKEMPIHVSKVMPLDTQADRPTRVRIGTDKDGKKVRIAARSGVVLDG